MSFIYRFFLLIFHLHGQILLTSILTKSFLCKWALEGLKRAFSFCFCLRRQNNMAGCVIKTDQLPEEIQLRLTQLFDSFEKYDQRFVKANPGSCILPAAYEKHKDRIKNFTLKDGDICLLTYPKCGTMWAQELISLVRNNFDFKKTQEIPLTERGVMLDFPFLAGVLAKDGLPVESMLERMENAPSPRLILSHLPFALLPDDLFSKCKVIICLRNPKDTLVSKYHFEKLIKVLGFVGDFESYFDLFMDDCTIYGSYFEHVKESWGNRHRDNVCLLFFEDMKKNLGENVRNVAKFLGKDFTDEQIEQSVEFLSFKKMKERGTTDKMQAMMKKKESDGHVMRKGESGDWKNNFTNKMTERMDEAIAKHLTPVGLEFQYE